MLRRWRKPGRRELVGTVLATFLFRDRLGDPGLGGFEMRRGAALQTLRGGFHDLDLVAAFGLRSFSSCT